MADVPLPDPAAPTAAPVAAAPPQPAPLPTSEQLFGKLPSSDELFGERPSVLTHPLSSEAWDNFFTHSAPGRVLSQFGQGVKEGWGAEPLGVDQDTEKALREAGVFNDYASGHTSMVKSFNEAVLRPLATLWGAIGRAPMAAITGVAAAGGQVFEEGLKSGAEAAQPVRRLLGQPEDTSVPEGAGERLARDIVALTMREGGAGGHAEPSPRLAEKARDLKVIGEGHAGWEGTAAEAPGAAERPVRLPEEPQAEPPAAGAAAEGEPSPGERPPAPAPLDVHQLARQIDPETMARYDALQTRKDTYRRWIDELDQERRAKAAESPEAKALQERVDDILGKVGGNEDRLTNAARDRLETARDQLDEILHPTGDSADMAKVRQELMKADFGQRDLAVDVSKAYARARELVPGEGQRPGALPESEAAPAAAETTSGAPSDAPGRAETVAQKPQAEPAAPGAPKIDNSHDVPYGAGASNDGQTVHIDRHIPQFDEKLKLPNGEPADLWKYLAIHEQEEHQAMLRGVPYEQAHLEVATKAERAAVEADGVDWGEYERIIDGHLAKIEHERPENPPPDLYLKPYPHEKAEILKRAGASVEEGRETPGPAASPEAPLRAAPAAETTPQHVQAIVDDLSQKLVQVGRSADEARAAAAIVAAHYEARAARFDGKLGNALDLYRAEAPGLRVAEKGGRGGDAAGKTVIKGARRVITLFGKADASTFMHETGHAWLEELMRDAADERAPISVKNDAKTVRDWLRATEKSEIKGREHEKFARGFERYLMEGRAPTAGLRGVFEQFRQWLTGIYKTVSGLRSPISDDIRDVFDRLIAKSPERQELAAAEPAAAAPKTQGDLLAAVHESDAEAAPPRFAKEAADVVEGEIERAKEQIGVGANAGRPEGGSEAGAGELGSAGKPAGEGGSVAGPAGGAAEPAAVGGSAGQAAAAGARARSKRDTAGTAYERIPREPRRLTAWLRSIGGVKDEGGDVASILGGAKYRPGLINSKGVPLDDAALRAGEEGYIPEAQGDRPTINELINAITEDVRSNPRYSEQDRAALEAYQGALARNAEIDRLADEHGIDPKGMTRAEFWDQVSAKMSEQEMAAEADSLGTASEHDMVEAERAARQEIEARGDAWQPEKVYKEGEPRSLEDLDNADRQEQAAGESEQGPGAAGPSGSVDQNKGPGQARPRSGGRGSGTVGSNPHSPFEDPSSELIDKAGNIRLDNLSTPDDIKEVLRESAHANNDFTDARRGVMSDAQVLDLADALGVDPTFVNRWKIGRAYSAEEIKALQKLLAQSAASVRDAMKIAAEGTDEDVMAYAGAKARHQMIQEQYAAVTAEGGRALRALAKTPEFWEPGTAATDQFIKEATGKTLFQMRREAQLGLNLETPAQVSKYMNDARKPTFGNMLVEYFVNNLISGPATHTTYMVGNSLLALHKALFETGTQAVIGAGREAVGLERGDRAYLGEVPAQLYGMMRGYRDGMAAGWEAVKSNQTGLLPGEEARPDLGMKQGAIPGIAGEVVRLPSRGVTGIHTFYRTMNYERELAGLSYRQAASEGLEGHAFAARLAELRNDPPAEMMERARTEANALTLMRKPEYGSPLYHLERIANSSVPTKLILPFVRIGSNIVREALVERSLFGLASPEVRANLTGRNGAAAQDAQMARIATGSAIAAGTVGMAMEGIVTGAGPQDPKQRALLQMTGWQPYSIRFGDTFVPYKRLGVLGMIVGTAAEGYELGAHMNQEEVSKWGASISLAVSETIIDETWMRGLSDLAKAVNDPVRYGSTWIRNLATDFVPYSTALGQIDAATDPYFRQARTVLDAVQRKVPGLSEGLMPRRDVFGDPIEHQPAFPVAGLSALYESRVKNDPTVNEMLRLGIFPSALPREIRGVKLSDQQYDDFQRIAGRYMRMRLDSIVKAPGWQSVPETVRRDVLNEAIKSSRELGRQAVMMQNPDIVRGAVDAKVARLSQPVKGAIQAP